MKWIFSFLIIATTELSAAADNYDVYIRKAPPKKPCQLIGKAKAGSMYAVQNAKKNRWDYPSIFQFNPDVTLAHLVQPGNDSTRFHEGDAVQIVGYVAKITDEGDESCNCGATKTIDTDTHINVVLDPATAKDKRTYFVVEVTPRLRDRIQKEKNFVWTTENLKAALEGKWVRVEGWLFFDRQHIGQAQNTHPKDPKRHNFRKTCWEIHPVTKIEFVNGP
jgi:hypothetical protein